MDKVNIYNLSTDAPNENNTGGARFITEPATVYLDQKEYVRMFLWMLVVKILL